MLRRVSPSESAAELLPRRVGQTNATSPRRPHPPRGPRRRIGRCVSACAALTCGEVYAWLSAWAPVEIVFIAERTAPLAFVSRLDPARTL